MLKGQGWIRGTGNKKVSITFTTLPGTPLGTVIYGREGHRCPEERQLLMPARNPPPSCCSDRAESSECICQKGYNKLQLSPQIYYTVSKWEIQNMLCWPEILFCNRRGNIQRSHKIVKNEKFFHNFTLRFTFHSSSYWVLLKPLSTIISFQS